MRVEDLDQKELLELDPEGGWIRSMGQRALILDVVALGLLRKYLVDNFGMSAARIVLTQFGFAHGWRMAEAVQTAFTWENDAELRCAGTRIASLGGLFSVASGSMDPLSRDGVMLLGSYEAEQHILHLGQDEGPVCWSICGLFSGFLSRVMGADIYVLEDHCMGNGDAGCHLLGRTREGWGDSRAEELRFFDPHRLSDCLDVSLQQIIQSLKAAERKFHECGRLLNKDVVSYEEPLGIVAKSQAMRRLVEMSRRVAKVDSTILITGESGSGKERIARMIHSDSVRAAGPFIGINCGAIAEPLLESELFGHVRGAYTGAIHDRPGLFEAANGGTLLLDEIGEISQTMQVKLLRVIQEREVRRVGENKNRKVNVRVIAATNRDLASGVASGNFRQDLFYRLNVVELHVPALRERRDDILPLARLLLTTTAQWLKRKLIGLSPAAAEQLLRYDWPGNVRELENAMERAVALAPGKRVELEDLPEEVRGSFTVPVASPGSVRPLSEIERDYILGALSLNMGNQGRTAIQLGISPATLYRKLRSYGKIARPRSKPKTEDPEGS